MLEEHHFKSRALAVLQGVEEPLDKKQEVGQLSIVAQVKMTAAQAVKKQAIAVYDEEIDGSQLV